MITFEMIENIIATLYDEDMPYALSLIRGINKFSINNDIATRC